jgi:hypothetical protein
MDNNNDKQQPSTKFIEIFSKVDKEYPSKKKLKSIQKYFSDNEGPLASGDSMSPDLGDLRPSPSRRATSEYLPLQRLSQNLISNQIKKTFKAGGMKIEPLDRGVEALRNELGYTTSSTIEQLLIDEIILEFFRKHQMQLLLTTLTTMKGTELRTIKKASELASTAQNRFNKAVQTLMNLRKSGIKLQINIATEGGKQVNLQK